MSIRPDLISDARALTACVDSILAPVPLLEAMHALAADSAEIRQEEIGATRRGTPISTFVFGDGTQPVLLYGFPDPGEAVGGTLILALARALLAGSPYLAGLDVRLHCVAVANPDDQPEAGQSLAPVRKTAAQEIDWWKDAPRPEATALLDYAAAIRPILTLPLHDEFHARDPQGAYMPTSHPLPRSVADAIRADMGSLGHPVSDSIRDDEMGPGFARMADLAGDEYPRSTFFALALGAPVFICEVASHPHLSDRCLVTAQACACLRVLEHRLAGGSSPTAS